MYPATCSDARSARNPASTFADHDRKLCLIVELHAFERAFDRIVGPRSADAGFRISTGSVEGQPVLPCSNARSKCMQLDYEAELAIVIGKGGRRIAAERASEHVAGYMITNDVSARDLGVGESKKLNVATLFQMLRAKGWDTFQPAGPWLVTADEVGSYEDIRIKPGSTMNRGKMRSPRR